MSYLYASQNFTFASVYGYSVSRTARILPVYLLVVYLSYLIYNYVDHAFIYTLNNGNIIRHLLLSGNVSVFGVSAGNSILLLFCVFLVGDGLLFTWPLLAYGGGRRC